jgi:RNA polymerase sigma factor (sigma-70 family)
MLPDAFEPHRPRLLGLAYRMVGSVASAEDIVQETWVRWASTDTIEQPRAWLTTVCSRLCLDELRSARVRKEEHVGPWLPEPWLTTEPPEPGPLATSLSIAILMLLEELSPKERAAFLLRDVFDEDYGRIAEVLELAEDNVRQLVRRARTAIDLDRRRFDADPAAHAALLEAFGAACASGDRATLEALLAEDVVATSDGGGRALAAKRPIHGRAAVAKFLLGIYRLAPPGWTAEPRWVNGVPGFVVRIEGKLWGVVALEAQGGQIVAYRTVLDPLKLGHVAASSEQRAASHEP